MPKINLLPKNVAELIAAGEVVERPSSVIKELVENSIDAGASNITVEIMRGGITYIRVTDNGCGISFDDVPTAFLRHATSKISSDNDLNAISTLGFRGEALAAISSVAKVEMLTYVKDAPFGTSYIIEGGNEVNYNETGCPEGTTIIIRDIFYNTPARMKFLKNDVSEANACASVIDRIALSHPEISFKFIRDGKQTLLTSGDGNVKSAVYSVLGRDFSGGLIEVKENDNSLIKVSGLTCKPIFCRPTRNNQFTFLNGRLVRSGTVVAAVEQAYKNSSMVGKFPGFVLYINIPYDVVDVNVHPAKTEVRFSDEKSVFEAVYVAIKNSLNFYDTRPEIKFEKTPFNKFEHLSTEKFRQQKIAEDEPTKIEKIYSNIKPVPNIVSIQNDNKPSFMNNNSNYFSKEKEIEKSDINIVKTEKLIDENKHKNILKENDDIILIGEAFSTYIIVQMNESIFLIDKHAAHERIIFNNLKKEHKIEIQNLLTPIPVTLTPNEYDTIISNIPLMESSGFDIEDFGNSSILVRTVPVYLTEENISLLISEIANGLITGNSVTTQREDDLFHTIACKAAIKAGSNTSDLEKIQLAKKVLNDNDVMYCPHGRPVSFEIKKRELEKQFGRIQ